MGLTATRQREAFTLLELLVAMVILALLSVVALGVFHKTLNSSENETTRLSLSNMASELAAVLSFDQSQLVTEDLLASLEGGPQALVSGVQATSDSWTWTTGLSTSNRVVSWSSFDSSLVNLALQSPTGKCAHASVIDAKDAVLDRLTDPPCEAIPASDGPAVVVLSDDGTSSIDPDDQGGSNDDGTGSGSGNDDPDDGTEGGGDGAGNDGDGSGGGSGGSDDNSTSPPVVWTSSSLAVNGDVELSGFVQAVSGPVYVNGNVTASGTVNLHSLFTSGTVTCSGLSVCGSGSASAQQLGAISSLVDTNFTVPAPRVLWDVYHSAFPHGRLNYTTSFEPGSWFDLCPNGSVRLPDGPAPCEGTLVGEGSLIDDWVGFEGWKFNAGSSTWVSSQGEAHGSLPFGPRPAWKNNNRPRTPAVYYVHEASARLEGSNGGNITVLVSKGGSPQSGNLEVAGAGTLYHPFLGAYLFVTDGDLKLRSSAPYTGWTGVGEQADLGGSTVYTGTMVVAGSANRPGSLISAGPSARLAASVWLHSQ